MRKYIPIILILVMLVLILGASSITSPISYGASEIVARSVKKVMTLMGDNNYSVTTIDMIIRKLSHFIEYLVITVLLSIGLSNLMRKKWFSLVLGGFIGFTVSLLDEGFIQAAVGRSSSLFDVLIDMTGILVGMLLFILHFTLSVRIKK